MHFHILGICGTFMAGIALLAKQLGHRVTGADTATYPPMTTQLSEQGIEYYTGYAIEHLNPRPECVIIGNALSRGNVEVEYVLNQDIPYISGAQWLSEYVLKNLWVLAVAGTHGKTTTTSMLAWILESAGLSPSFLIGGIAHDFGVSARLTTSKFFVIEADEYDTAFFDKRSKFVHYRPRTVVLNNLEFDHADIFPDLSAIQRQFHHLVRIVPSEGLIVYTPQPSLKAVLNQGVWTPVQTVGYADSDWQANNSNADSSCFDVVYRGQKQGNVNWHLIGEHNVFNALSAIASANHIGVSPQKACESLCTFQGVKRRLELRGVVQSISIYDDFAHHPTAIEASIRALRRRVQSEKIIAVLEPRSNTMRMGVHQHQLSDSLKLADVVLLYQPAHLTWSLSFLENTLPSAKIFTQVTDLIEYIVKIGTEKNHVLIMSNGGFDNIHARLLDSLQVKKT
jgi:UDP-N-acetylmuramate: L-alanyl-gamma-D-glutamyl-meso-diaminopimelate ligase